MTEANEPIEPIATDEPEDPGESGETTEEPGGATEPETPTAEPDPPCTLIEAIVIRHLATELNTTHVYAERPIDLPDEYHIIEKTSSEEVNHIQMATVAVQSITRSSLLRAAAMSKAAERAMKTLINEPDVSRCKLNSAYNFTDTETKEYRYQAVFDIYYMEGE